MRRSLSDTTHSFYDFRHKAAGRRGQRGLQVGPVQAPHVAGKVSGDRSSQVYDVTTVDVVQSPAAVEVVHVRVARFTMAETTGSPP